jgi:outer membrane lipoprotein
MQSVLGRMGHLAVVGLVLASLAGCTHAISRPNRQDALKGLTPESIISAFDTYQGQLVLMGGEIIETRNLERETVIEVLQKPLSQSSERPVQRPEYHGRFWVRYDAFKDPYVFGKGREITVAGIVVGKEVSKIGRRDYTYLVLENKETHLWPERADSHDAYFHDFPYPPFWWYDPWWPHWYPRRYRY